MSKIDEFYKNNFDKNFDNVILNYDLDIHSKNGY